MTPRRRAASAAGRLLGVEGIQELRLITNPFNAEYGKAASAVFTAVSRSGSNELHGSAYYFARNSALDARNFFDDPASPIPSMRRHQFGGLLSGPIRKNKLFYLLNYEGIRENRSSTQRAFTITEAARRGDLPSGRITVDPAVRPYLDYYPMPNGRDFGDGSGEYFSQAESLTDETYIAAKLDYQASDAVRTAVRFTTDGAERSQPDELQIWKFIDDSRFAFLSSETQITQSPGTLHAFRFGYSRVRNVEDGLPPAGTEALAFVPGRPLGQLEVSGLTDLTGALAAAGRESIACRTSSSTTTSAYCGAGTTFAPAAATAAYCSSSRATSRPAAATASTGCGICCWRGRRRLT